MSKLKALKDGIDISIQLGFRRVGSISNVPIYIHWSLPLITVVLTVLTLVNSGSVSDAATFASAVIMIFSLVLCHEWGHILAARRFGIPCYSIMLSPIGGAAVLPSIGGNPKEVVAIALAGPAVNLIFSVITLPVLFITDGQPGFLIYFLAVNILMMVFNMLPAYPLDGGRVLQGILWRFVGLQRSIVWSCCIGMCFAIIIGTFAIINLKPLLLLVAFFVFFISKRDMAIVRN